jgi:hypothetical protein
MRLLTPYQKPILGATLNPSHPLTKDLVGCWLMNERWGWELIDSSGNGCHGSLWYTAARTISEMGPCLSFNADNGKVETQHNMRQNFKAGFTLACWAKPASTDAAGVLMYLYDSTSGDGYQLFQNITGSGCWEFDVWVNTHVHGAASLVPPTGGWELVVGTRSDTGELKIYTNGIFCSTSGSSTVPGEIVSSDTMRIGLNAGNSNDYIGQISSCYSWNRELSASEILSLYRSPYAMFQRDYRYLYGKTSSAAVRPQRFDGGFNDGLSGGFNL